MITKKTLAAMTVPSIAPIWMYSALLENRWLTAQAASVTSTSNEAPMIRSFAMIRQRPSYMSQAATSSPTLIAIASHGSKSATDLSIRYVSALT